MSVADRVEPVNVVWWEFNRKFDLIPHDTCIDLGIQPGMNGTGEG